MNNLDGFEIFEGRRTRSQSALFVTIQQRGNFCLNKASFEALGRPEAVVMLFNRTARKAAFRAAKSDESNRIPVRTMGSSYLIAGRTFTKEYDINTSVARRYRADIQEGVLIIDAGAQGTDVSKHKDSA